MAKKSMVVKQQRKQKYAVREYTRCARCGRPHAVLKKYGISKQYEMTNLVRALNTIKEESTVKVIIQSLVNKMIRFGLKVRMKRV